MINILHNKQQTTQRKPIVDFSRRGAGISLPAVSVLQKKEEIANELAVQKKETRQFVVGNKDQMQLKTSETGQTPTSYGKPIQFYQYGPHSTQDLKIKKGAKLLKTFTVGKKGEVSFDTGENITANPGSETGRPAEWKGWISDGNVSGNAATQMHLVNADWGGIGDKGDANIAPGSQNLNHNHLTDAEDPFRKLCPKNLAPENIKYECEFTYPQTVVDIANGSVKTNDPTLTVDVTKSSGNLKYPVSTGNGINFTEGVSED